MGSLTQFQRDIVIGSILGDGYLRILPGRSNAFLEVNQSAKVKEYVDWKFGILKNICISPPKARNGNGGRVAYRFFTKQHPELTELYRVFYQNGKKVVPDNIKLNTTILAIWFMDDGGRCGDKNFYLNTQQFSRENQEVLIDSLGELGLRATLNKDKIYHRIRFLSESIPWLKDLLKDIVIPSMQYKLGYNPVETCSANNGTEPLILKKVNTPAPPKFCEAKLRRMKI